MLNFYFHFIPIFIEQMYFHSLKSYLLYQLFLLHYLYCSNNFNKCKRLEAMVDYHTMMLATDLIDILKFVSSFLKINVEKLNALLAWEHKEGRNNVKIHLFLKELNLCYLNTP